MAGSDRFGIGRDRQRSAERRRIGERRSAPCLTREDHDRLDLCNRVERLFNPHALVEDGTISEEDLELFQYVDDPQQAWQQICDFYGLPPAQGQ